MRTLRALAVTGPLVFSVDWLLLGWSHAGYRPRQETISSLSAHGATRWPVMAAGQVALGVAFVALALLCRRVLGRWGGVPAGLFVLAAYGTAQLTVFRTICNDSDAGWCTPLPHSAFGHEQWLHGIGTALAFGGLQLACVATAWVTWSRPGLRDVALVALVAEGVALPSMLWFLSNAETTWHGLAEKTFLVALAAFASYTGHRLGSEHG